MDGEMSTGPLALCVLSLFFKILHLPLSAFFFFSLIFQVFVNFAKEQHEDEDSEAYDNKVDTSDELPLRSMRASYGGHRV